MDRIKKIRDILVISLAIAAMIVLAGKITPFKDLNASIISGGENTVQGTVSKDVAQTTSPGEPRLDMEIDEELFKPAEDTFKEIASGDDKDRELTVDAGPNTPVFNNEKDDKDPGPAQMAVEKDDDGQAIQEDQEEIIEMAAPAEEVIDYSRSEDFRIEVDLDRQRVMVFHKDDLLREMICSGGASGSPTPLGEYVTSQKIEYAWVERFGVGAYYWIRFFEDYLIHSVPFDENGVMIFEEYTKLGSPASHGCIRLKLEEAKWLYDMLPLGVKVLIY